MKNRHLVCLSAVILSLGCEGRRAPSPETTVTRDPTRIDLVLRKVP
jgi:hypothetical protein